MKNILKLSIILILSSVSILISIRIVESREFTSKELIEVDKAITDQIDNNLQEEEIEPSLASTVTDDSENQKQKNNGPANNKSVGDLKEDSTSLSKTSSNKNVSEEKKVESTINAAEQNYTIKEEAEKEERSKTEITKEYSSQEKNSSENNSINTDYYNYITHGEWDYDSSKACYDAGLIAKKKELNDILDYNEKNQDNQIKPDIKNTECYPVNTKDGLKYFLHINCDSGNCNQKYKKKYLNGD